MSRAGRDVSGNLSRASPLSAHEEPAKLALIKIELRPRASSKPLNGRYLAITKPNSQTIMGYGAVTFVAGGILQVIVRSLHIDVVRAEPHRTCRTPIQRRTPSTPPRLSPLSQAGLQQTLETTAMATSLRL
jgi:hypothetical protein